MIDPLAAPAHELAAWLRLLAVPTLGRRQIRQLLAIYESPAAVLAASPTSLREVGNAALVEALAAPAPELDELASAQLTEARAWLDGDPSPSSAPARAIIAIGDPRYPQWLLESADPPLLLYALGRAELLQVEAAVAIVGSRHPTPQGLENARAFAAELSSRGVLVVSGLALGIDGAAHEGALEGRGSTIAVVGTGIDRVYPRRHLELARRIANHGLIVSEFPLGTAPVAPHFPQRNRIIAGLARGTLVVEAALLSGSLITARFALESGRDVYAIPGSIHSVQARGCNALIKQGAKLVDCAGDILEELQLPVAENAPASMDLPMTTDHRSSPSRHEALLQALGFDPMSLDELVARTGRAAQDLSGSLLELELEGLVARMPGQVFQRVALA